MRARVFIRLGPLDHGNAQWLRLDESGTAGPLGQGSLEEAAVAASGAEVIVLIPGTEVLLSEAAIPSRNRQRIAEAIPFALEDQVIDDVEDLHFALGERDGDGNVHVAIVARERMDAWLDALHGTGLRPDAVVPDVLAVPYAEGEWTLVEEEDVSLLRTGAQVGYGFDTRNMNTMLPAAFKHSGEEQVRRLHVISRAEDVQIDVAELAGEVQVDSETRPDSPLAVLARGYDAGTAINLLQGPYSRREQLGRLWRPWRPAAALLLAWLYIQAGVAVVEYHHLEHQQEALRVDVRETFHRAFPEVHNIVNPKVQMQRKLDALRGGGDASNTSFVKLLADIGPQLVKDASVKVNHLSYSDGKFDLAITIGDLQRLDDLKQRLTKGARFLVNIQSATSGPSGVEARLQVRGKAS